MNGNNTVELSAASADELERIEGGLFFLALSFVPSGAVGYAGTKLYLESKGGGGEALPGLGQFLAGTTAIATAAGGGHPQ